MSIDVHHACFFAPAATFGCHNPQHLGVSLNGGTPKSSILLGFSHYKPSILGYHNFRKPPSASDQTKGKPCNRPRARTFYLSIAGLPGQAQGWRFPGFFLACDNNPRCDRRCLGVFFFGVLKKTHKWTTRPQNKVEFGLNKCFGDFYVLYLNARGIPWYAMIAIRDGRFKTNQDA